MKNKRLLILSAAALLGLAACGNNPSETSSLTSSEAAASAASSEAASSSEKEVVKYTVTFDLAGGTLGGLHTVEPQSVEEGHWAKKPIVDPVKEHCTFEGWFTSDGFPFNFMTQIYGDVTLVAHWSVIESDKITLTFDPNNGQAQFTVDTFVGDYIAPQIPTPPSGMSFRGWYIDGDTTHQFTGSVTSDVVSYVRAGSIIKALYEKESFNFKFVLDGEGNATITGLININATVASIPSSIAGHPVIGIANSAFSSRTYLTEVNVPATVKNMTAHAFIGARALANVNVDPGNPYFKSINGIVYSKDGTVLVCAPQKNTNGTFTIPSGVKKIGTYAFYGQNEYYGGITGINFPEGLEEIGDRAFYNCNSIKSLTFPSSLKKIGDYAFATFTASADKMVMRWNDGLEEIGNDAFMGVYLADALEIPNSVKKIGEFAFATPQGSNNAITKVKLPSSLEELGAAAFYNDFGIGKISLDASNEHYVVKDNILYTKDMKKLVWAPSDTASVTGNSDIVIPEGVEELGTRSLGELRYMTSLTLPKSLLRIDDEAFHGSHFLTSIVIPDKVEYIGASAFDYCDALLSVTFGSGVKEIGSYAFGDNTALRSVSFPKSLRKIGRSAFFGTPLATINFNEGLEEIGDTAFNYNPASSYDEEGYGPTISAKLTSIVLPDSLKTLGNGAFANQSAVTSITFGAGLQSIGLSAFGGDNRMKPSALNLTSAAVAAGWKVSNFTVYNADKTALYCSPALNGAIMLEADTLKVGEGAFDHVKATGITAFPEGLTEIGEGAFEYAFASSATINLEFPSTLKAIEDGAFYFADVDKVTFKEGLQTIGEGAFTFSDIGSVVFPNSLSSIGNSAFAANMNLSSITFGSGLKELGDEAFFNVTKPSSVVLPSSLEKLGDGIFAANRKSSLATISFAGANANYVAEDNVIYSKDKSLLKMVAPGRTTSSLLLPDSVKEIASYGIYDVQTMTSLDLGKGIERIGDYGLGYNTSLASLKLPSTLTYIGDRFMEGSGKTVVTADFSIEYSIIHFHSDWLGGSNLASISYLGE